jgi:hypothetical protein
MMAPFLSRSESTQHTSSPRASSPGLRPSAEGEVRLLAVRQHYGALAQVLDDALQYLLGRLYILRVPHAIHAVSGNRVVQ